MEIFRGDASPVRDADPKTFVGNARIQHLAGSDAGTPVVVYHVEFEEGGRTNWHIHHGAQWLLMISGRVRVQVWGEPLAEIAAGDAVVIAPGEKHWHSAAPGGPGVHIAVNVSVKTDWLEPVSDEQYRGVY
jgi:quercetin dioxygenase-like cupin family protein